MSRKKTVVQEPQCPEYTHYLSKSLADYQHQKQADRFTKYEAFRDLLEMAATENATQCANATLQPLNVTISQLALAWAWHRHTVSSFLDGLADLGVLSKEKTTDGFLLRFTSLTVSAA